MWLNGEDILSKDEIRIYTPYNNFCLADLKEGKNKIVLKLLRRTEKVEFTLEIRKYDGNHWHRSKFDMHKQRKLNFFDAFLMM